MHDRRSIESKLPIAALSGESIRDPAEPHVPTMILKRLPAPHERAFESLRVKLERTRKSTGAIG